MILDACRHTQHVCFYPCTVLLFSWSLRDIGSNFGRVQCLFLYVASIEHSVNRHTKLTMIYCHFFNLLFILFTAITTFVLVPLASSVLRCSISAKFDQGGSTTFTKKQYQHRHEKFQNVVGFNFGGKR